MSKIKLAYVAHGLSSNGIESLLVNIAHYIDMNKYDVTFIIAIDKDVKALHEGTVKKLGANVIHICDLDSVEKKLKYIKELEKTLSDGKYDIVHANMDLLNGIVLKTAKRAGVPKRICHAHNSSSQYAITGNKSTVMQLAQKFYQSAMKKLIIKNATCLLGCSDKANEYMYGKRASSAKIINNGILLDRFFNPEEKSFEQLGMNEGFVNLVTVGRLSSQKNPMFIIDIIDALSRLRRDFVLNWAGGGEMEKEIRSAIEQKKLSGFINMLGVRTDIPPILKKCSYFLMPSLFEGLPVSLIEAQAAGLECFVSDEISRMSDFGACRFIPLEAGAEKWAEIIDNSISSKSHLRADREKLLEFDISRTVMALDRVYSE